jgi:hypothetical protein
MIMVYSSRWIARQAVNHTAVFFALLESITDEERKWQGISELWRELSEISKEMFSFYLGY